MNPCWMNIYKKCRFLKSHVRSLFPNMCLKKPSKRKLNPSTIRSITTYCEFYCTRLWGQSDREVCALQIDLYPPLAKLALFCVSFSLMFPNFFFYPEKCYLLIYNTHISNRHERMWMPNINLPRGYQLYC